MEYDQQEVKNLRLDFLSLISGKYHDYSRASEMLVNYIESNCNIYTTKVDLKSEMWIYKDGIYIPQGRSEIKEIIRHILGDIYNQFHFNLIINKIETDTFIDANEFFKSSYTDEIIVKNGILNLRTRKLSSFTPDKIFFSKCPVVFNPEKKCPMIDYHFSEVLKNPEDKKVLYELIGYCLENTHFIEKAFMFVGNGRNGKGKTQELIKRLVGPESCCSVPLSCMKEDSFNLWQLHGKKVNIAGDLNNTDLKDTGLFKSLTGRDLITAHRKFMTDLIFTSTCKNIFACNELPKVYDLSKGFWSRWILLEFPYEFIKLEELNNLSPEDKQNKKIIDTEHIQKICSDEELSGLLNEALNGLERLWKNKDFSYSVGTNQIKEFWIRKANSFTAFCYDCIETNEKSSINKDELRRRYNHYRNIYKLKGCGDKEIKATLEDLFGVGEGRKDESGVFVHTWTGIGFKNDSKCCSCKCQLDSVAINLNGKLYCADCSKKEKS